MDKVRTKRAIFIIILDLEKKLRDTDLGIPISEVHKAIKREGIYQEGKFISKRLKEFERAGFIHVDNWNIVKIDKTALEKL